MTDIETELRAALTDAANLITTAPDAWAEQRRRTMARHPRRRRLSVGLAVAAVTTATAAIVVGAALLVSGHQGHPATGVSDGQVVDLTPRHDLSAQQLGRAASIIQQRLRGFGVTDARVAVNGSGLRAHVPAGSAAAVATAVDSRGVLRFRQALSMGTGTPTISPGGSAVAVGGPAESQTLSASFLALYARWDCAEHPDPTHGNDVSSDYVIGCATDRSVKYLLAPAALEGTQVRSADAGLDAQGGHQWVVNLRFSVSGARSWLALTAKANKVNHGQPQTTSCSPPVGCDAVAIVFDGVVQSAPYVQTHGGIAGGVAQISGDFTPRSADQLAAILRAGPLPTTFAVSSR